MQATLPSQIDWLKNVLFDRGYLARLKGEAIKVYLIMVNAAGGEPDRSVTLSLNALMTKTNLTCPTIIQALSRLEELGLVVSTTRRKGRTTTYYIPDPPWIGPVEDAFDPDDTTPSIR
jgi:pyocin large subunit-like protein